MLALPWSVRNIIIKTWWSWLPWTLWMLWCSGYHYYTTSGVSEIHHGKNLTVTLAGNKAKCLLSVNHTTKTNHHHQHMLLLLASAAIPLLPCKYETNRNNNIFSSMAILHYLAPSITYYIYMYYIYIYVLYIYICIIYIYIVLNKPQTKS